MLIRRARICITQSYIKDNICKEGNKRDIRLRIALTLIKVSFFNTILYNKQKPS